MVGTVRPNRSKNCQLSNDKIMQQKGRGSPEIKICVSSNVEIRAIKWFNIRVVNILKSYETVVPCSQVKKYARKEKKKLPIYCPEMWCYNKNMGGVNLLSYYRIPVKFKKRYHCLIWHFLDVACIQIWLYKKDAAATFVFETLQNCRWPNHCYIKRKSYVGDHQDHQLTRVTQQ